MYVSNLHNYGHLLNADNYETTHLHNDIYSLFDNALVSYILATCIVLIFFCFRTGKEDTYMKTGLKFLKMIMS